MATCPYSIPGGIPDGYTFTPFKDSPGFAWGPFNYRDIPLIANDCSADAGCLAFNSNGWLKSQIEPEEDWETWTSDPCLGFYVKEPCAYQVPNGYTFYPLKDSPGSAWGQFNYRDIPLIANDCDADAGCLAFNSNGWLKWRIEPEEDWETWTTDPCLGFFVKECSNPVPNGYTFLPLMDSFGNDIGLSAGQSISEIASDCDAAVDPAPNSTCVAFNSNGWYKFETLPVNEWDTWTTDPCLGLYVKECANPVPNGYTFYPLIDSYGNDIGLSAGQSISEIASDCDAAVGPAVNSTCVAFNSNGWFKFETLPVVEWDTWTTDPCLGLYVKNI